MTNMGFFFLGFIVGVAVCGCFAVLLIPRKRRRQPPVVWTDEHYQTPPAKTHILIRERNISL